MPRKISLSSHIRNARIRRGLSVADVAAQVGVTGPCVYFWEAGRTRPRDANLNALCKVLKLPIRATGDGIVQQAQMSNGYGREVVIDHGHGVETVYGHMSGFAVIAGQTVVRGQVIGYVGMSGRITGANLHYEVRIHNAPVNPHKYLRETLAGMGSLPSATKAGS